MVCEISFPPNSPAFPKSGVEEVENGISKVLCFKSKRNNGGFYFIIYKLWCGKWHVQNIVEKMMLLWAINCGFLIHTGLIWRDFELVPKKKFQVKFRFARILLSISWCFHNERDLDHKNYYRTNESITFIFDAPPQCACVYVLLGIQEISSHYLQRTLIPQHRVHRWPASGGHMLSPIWLHLRLNKRLPKCNKNSCEPTTDQEK